jgi:Protein kinase C terminal domain
VDRRLGSGDTDAEEVKAHPYFRNINWDDIYHKRVPVPFMPQLQHATDTSNFDQEFTRETPVLTPVTSGTSSPKNCHLLSYSRLLPVLTPEMQEQFRGFSYVADPDSI